MTFTVRKRVRPAVLQLVAAIGDPGEHWKHKAACGGHPRPDIFHPPPARADAGITLKRSQAEQRRRIIIAEAKTVCANCHVRNQCLSYAEARGIRYGIWGGLTPQERGYDREER